MIAAADFQPIAVNKLYHPVNQLRVRLDKIPELAESIRMHGLLAPLTVRPTKHGFEVIAGNRRLEAIKLLKMAKAPCRIIDLSDKEAYEVAIGENLHHDTLNPIEEAVAFKRYVDSFGWGGV
jgi:ParB family chromosome partitioning protein